MNEGARQGKAVGASLAVSYRTLLILIILGSVALRLWGLDFGLPQVFHPDEPVVVTRAQYGAATNDWNPRAFHWPSLQIYILGFEYKIWYWVGGMTGAWESEEYPDIPPGDRFIAYALRAPGGFYYLGRFTTVLFGAGLVWIMYLLSRRFMSEPAALAATSLVALNPILARQGRYVTPDIPAEFFFLAALWAIDRLYMLLRNSRSHSENQEENRGNHVAPAILAAVLVGLGTGTKYPVAILAVPLVAVMLFAPSGQKAGTRVNLAVRATLTVIIVFFLTTPFAILDFGKFLTDVRTIGWHVRTGHIGMEATGGIWLASLRQFLADSGWVWTVVGATGLIGFCVNLRRTWPIVLGLVFALAGLAPLDVFSDRYLVPLVPYWAIGIGWLIDKLEKVESGKWRLPGLVGVFAVILPGIAEGLSRFRIGITSWIIALALSIAGTLAWSHWLKGKAGWALAVAVVLSVLATGGRGTWVTCRDANRLTLPDTREFALEWVETNIPAHSVIVEEQGGPQLNTHELVPLVPEPWYVVEEITPLFWRGGTYRDPLDRLVEVAPEWVITSSEVRSRYMREGAEEEFSGVVAVFREYYRLIEENLIEEARFAPADGIVGPEIVIYSVPEGFWDRVILEEASVEEVLGLKTD